MIDRTLAEGLARFDMTAIESTPAEHKENVRREIMAIAERRDESYSEAQIDAMVESALNDPTARPRGKHVFDASALEGVPVIVGDEVGLYCAQFPDGSDISDAVATLAPPFDSFWIEFQRVPNPFGFHAWGVLIESLDESPDPHPGDDGAPRWVLKLSVFAELHKRAAMGPITVFVAGLAEDGTWFRHHDGDLWWGGGLPEMTTAPPAEVDGEWGDSCVPLVFPALMAISFMHCKNVSIRSVTPPTKLSKKHEKRTGRGLIRYHVLDIEPMRQVLDSSGATTHGIRRALHVSRGHFKVFTDDAPLFGRHVGTYWWASHVRGKSNEGVVVKDYRVVPPGILGREYVTASEEPGTPPSPSETDPDAAGRGKGAHGRTQNLVAATVAGLGCRPRSPAPDEPLYDLAWENGDTTWVCEVKSLTDTNQERQMQRAIGQVIRYRQKMIAAGRDVQAVIVTEKQPLDESWDSLCTLEGIVLAWPDVLAERLLPK